MKSPIEKVLRETGILSDSSADAEPAPASDAEWIRRFQRVSQPSFVTDHAPDSPHQRCDEVADEAGAGELRDRLVLAADSQDLAPLVGLLGNRVVFHRCWPNSQFLAIASSRMGRDRSDQAAWIRSLRAACSQATDRGSVLLVVRGTSTEPFVLRCHELLGIDACVVSISTKRSVCEWLRNDIVDRLPNVALDRQQNVAPKQVDREASFAKRPFAEILISPPIDGAFGQSADTIGQTVANLDTSTIAHADAALAAIGHRLIVLSTRSGGNWHRLLRWRLASAQFAPATTCVAVGDPRTPRAVSDELLASGAVGWTVWPKAGRESSSTSDDLRSDDRRPDGRRLERRVMRKSADSCGNRSASSMTASQNAVSPSLGGPSLGGPSLGGPSLGEPETGAAAPRHKIQFEAFLTHCTRRCDGPWPNQSEQAYLDDLIFERHGADHSPLAVLQRILIMKCLLGSSESIRGETPVVSFTAVPLPELKQLRVFRPHRGRWDFEPYGICIRRSWVMQHNGKPVTYASRVEWESMPHSERLFCHIDATTTKSGNRIDWTVEQEWRTLGDLDLTDLPPDDAFVFVPSPADAAVIARVSSWPVVALSDLETCDE